MIKNIPTSFSDAEKNFSDFLKIIFEKSHVHSEDGEYKSFDLKRMVDEASKLKDYMSSTPVVINECIVRGFYTLKKTIQEIYDEMLTEVGDKKTINNNLEAINNSVLHRACIYNKEKGNN